MFLRSTDLPVPDGPNTAEIFPRGTSKVTSLRTVWLPKRLVTPRREMTGSGISPSGSVRTVSLVVTANLFLPSTSAKQPIRLSH